MSEKNPTALIRIAGFIAAIGMFIFPMAATSPALAAKLSDADSDFKLRCSSQAVVLCVGFDAPEDFTADKLLPSFDEKIRITLDPNVKSSGEGSARFEIPSLSAASASGGWLSFLGRKFGPGDRLYLQFRQRFSAQMLKTKYEPGGGWKQIIIYGNASCGSLELTTVNQYLQGFPTMYTDCGSRNLQTEISNGDVLLQQGDYNCHYQGSRPPRDCGYYRPDQWMTFYYEVELGEWDSPTSQIRAYMAYEDEPLKQFVNMKNYALQFDSSPADRYQHVLLTTYMTYKDMKQVHPTAYTWYDELIVSTQPIPAPR